MAKHTGALATILPADSTPGGLKPTDVYSLVGCRECDALWVVEDRPETTTCPRCQTRHPFDRLEPFAKDEDEAVVREARTRLLAKRQGDAEAIADLGHYEDLAADVEDAGIDEKEYLERVGVDTDAVAEKTPASGTGRGNENRRDVVVRAIREIDAPTAEEIVAFASERDVPPDRAREVLEKLTRAGAVSESDGQYRGV